MGVNKTLLAAVIAAMGGGSGPPSGDLSVNTYVVDGYADDYFV